MTECFFHGHSFVEIVSGDCTIIIDPFVTGNRLCDITLDELLIKKSNILILTHGHGDHIGDSIALLQTHPSCIVVASYGIIKWLQSQGLTNPMQGLGIGGTWSNEQVHCKLVNAVHDGSILDTGLSTHPSGIIITMNDKRIYHAGDTALHTDMQLIPSRGPIDVALLPIGDYYTMGVDDAIIATSWIKPTIVVPIHYNTFPTIKADDMEFARQVMLHKYATPKVLKPGQSIVLE